MKNENRIKYVFFKGKLGLKFRVVEGKMTLIDSNQDIKISRESLLALRDSEDMKDFRESDLQDYQEERESMVIPDISLCTEVRTDLSEALTISEDTSQSTQNNSNNILDKPEVSLVQQNLKTDDSTKETSQIKETSLLNDEKQSQNINLDVLSIKNNLFFISLLICSF